MNREVTMELLEKYGKEFVQDRANRVAQNAVVGKGVNAAMLSLPKSCSIK